MFGYITPVQGELKVKDLNKFKSYYCGLCLCIKKRFGNIPRIFLNYETTFFAVLLDGLCADSLHKKSNCCIRHPLSKTTYIYDNEAINYAADLNISLAYYKLLDNVLDDNDFKSLSSSKILKYYYDNVSNNDLKDTIHNSLENLHKVEKSNNLYSIDEISHPFSHIVGFILKNYPGKFSNDSEKIRNYLYNFGYSFGKWIYLMDALDDLKDDMNHGKFNPLEKVYNNNNNNNLSYNQLIEIIKENFDFTILNLVNNCSEVINKIPFTKNSDIVKNIVDLGLVDKYMNILNKI